LSERNPIGGRRRRKRRFKSSRKSMETEKRESGGKVH
jgi:hypothetical protein